MRKVTFTLMVGASLLLSSCATIVSGSRQTVKFDSTPSNAMVYINEMKIGRTPLEHKLSRDQDYDVMIKLDGYTPYKTRLTRKFNAWYIGNILFGGLIGLIIDPITGAMYKLSPAELNARLEGETAFVKGKNIYLAVSLDIDPNWEKVGQLEKIK